jgi:glycosyltransferase involved in cell wall biosynthesis
LPPTTRQNFGLGAFAGLAHRRLLEIHNQCDINFAPTTSIARELHQHGMQRVAVCGRGVDTTQFNPRYRDTALRDRWTRGRNCPILLYVGRISPEKNLSMLAAVARALPEYPLLIVGDGPARNALAAELAGRDVHFTGTLGGEELAQVYACSDVFLFPSATETFGQVVREAMASGLPVVGMRAGGVQDLIEDGRTGKLCPPGDAAAFVAAARDLAENAARRREMGVAAQREAERHTWTAVFDQLMDCYAGLIGRGAIRNAG